ncbi:uncharacterized protein LOC129905537 [Episyrphus balteatus]|uniref:uncharacterized protein LOC129905537 n=1 Tax=Episyrphus balteatus TaxID=286459 RepID=UPI00248585FD|nr:uncharacterized protein LOC129905537 [Episyrphus balteatus]XP_055836986.1 uncharacterized protein LOC129905537 [Episyrphus balteatus]
MDYRGKSRTLIVWIILIVSGIQGQLDDFMKICDLCNFDGLLDCNSTNIFHINMTINCEMTKKMCTLGINECFEGFEDLTLHDIDHKHICIFKDMSKELAESSINMVNGAESLETLGPYDSENTPMSIFDIQPDEVTFKDDSVESTTINQISTETSKMQEITKESSLMDLQDNQQQDEDKTSSYLTETSMTIITSTGSYETPILVTEIPYQDESLTMQQDAPEDLKRNFNNNMEPLLENEVPVPNPEVETVSCFVCESLKDDACLGRIEELKTIDCPKPTGCVSYHSDGNIVRNCGSVISAGENDLCRKPSNKSCDTCPSGECNKKPWKECFKCNSKDDPNCALWSNAETVPYAVCPNYNDNCLVRITKEGDTLRECSPSDVKCGEDELCSICEGPLCNSGVFPPNRLQCIQCQECEDVQDPINALPCLNYNANEKCFLYVTAKSKMYRGCISNVTDMRECQNNESKCITCNEKNGCNNVPLMKEPTLSCSKCKSKEDPSCLWEQPETTVLKCVKKYLFHLTESCLTQFNPSTQEAVRDCSMDYGVCTSEDQDCKTCSENGCNRGNLMEQQCIQCQSDQPGQMECQNQAAGIPPVKCPPEKQTYENRGCFTLTKGNVTFRGCVANLSKEDSQLCKKNGETSCVICVKDLCNNVLAPSRSSKTVQMSLFTLFSVILTMI